MDAMNILNEIISTKLITIGGTQVTIKNVFILVLILVLTYFASKWIRKIIDTALEKQGIKSSERYPLLKLTHYSVVVIGAYLAFNSIGIPLTGLLAAAGIFGVVLGFGLQSITSNLVSGIILLSEGTIKVGDLVDIGNNFGEVTSTSIRATTIRTFDNHYIIIPNQEFFTKPFINYTHADKKVRIGVSVGVAYGSNVEKIKELLLEVARENEKVLDRPEPIVFFEEHGDNALIFELKCWVSSPFNRRKTESELNTAINQIFKQEGIKIPFPQREIWMQGENDEKRRNG